MSFGFWTGPRRLPSIERLLRSRAGTACRPLHCLP